MDRASEEGRQSGRFPGGRPAGRAPAAWRSGGKPAAAVSPRRPLVLGSAAAGHPGREGRATRVAVVGGAEREVRRAHRRAGSARALLVGVVADVATRAAVVRVGRGVDACAVTVRLAPGTLARPVGARAAGTSVAARPAVVRVRRDVHARPVAERLSDRTDAVATVAPLPGRACMATRAAVLGVVPE